MAIVLIIALAESSTRQTSSNMTWWTSAIVAAIVAAAVSVVSLLIAGRRARLDRQRELFGEAFEVVMEYREFPFIVRRRSTADRDAERVRISGDLSAVQARLNAYSARLRVEAPSVGTRYTDLVAATRRVAGPMIREAWNNDPAPADDQVHSPGWDFTELDAFDDEYLRSVSDHLSWVWTPARRGLRHMWSKVRSR